MSSAHHGQHRMYRRAVGLLRSRIEADAVSCAMVCWFGIVPLHSACPGALWHKGTTACCLVCAAIAGVIHRKPDAAPNDPAAFELRDHFAMPVR